MIVFFSKVYLEYASDVPDHCVVYALSDPSDKDLKKHCDHQYGYACDQQALEVTLKAMKQKVNECSPSAPRLPSSHGSAIYFDR